jgi:2'-5' RNA ligase
VQEPTSPIHPKGEEAPAKPFVMPSTVEEIDDAMDANAARYSKATDPAERRHILDLQELLEDHRAAIAPPEPEHKFSSTQLDLPDESSAAVKEMGATIPDKDLAPDGREDKPHITVKYGLHGEDPEAVRKLLAKEPPVTVKLGKTSFFPNGESENGDVVKVDVDSPELHKLNKKIANAMPHTDTHPEYKPHVTIAYVRPGLGKRYEGNASLEGHTMTFDRLTFSAKDGTKHEIVLGGKPKAVSQKKQGNVLRSPTWDDAKKDLTLDATAEMDEVRSAARTAGFDGLVVNGEHIDLRKPKEPVHESARVPSGGLRDNFETVKNDGLIKEMFAMLGADDPSDSIRAIYRTVEARRLRNAVRCEDPGSDAEGQRAQRTGQSAAPHGTQEGRRWPHRADPQRARPDRRADHPPLRRTAGAGGRESRRGRRPTTRITEIPVSNSAKRAILMRMEKEQVEQSQKPREPSPRRKRRRKKRSGCWIARGKRDTYLRSRRK